IETKSNSFSTTKSESPQEPQVPAAVPEIQQPIEQDQVAPTMAAQEPDEMPPASRVHSSSTNASASSSRSTSKRTSSEADSRKRSSTIKTRLASKSSIPAGVSLGTGMTNGLSPRSQNVPSAAAPATNMAESPPSPIGAPYEQQE